LRYKFLILHTNHPDTIFPWGRMWKSVVIFRRQKWSASKMFVKQWYRRMRVLSVRYYAVVTCAVGDSAYAKCKCCTKPFVWRQTACGNGPNEISLDVLSECLRQRRQMPTDFTYVTWKTKQEEYRWELSILQKQTDSPFDERVKSHLRRVNFQMTPTDFQQWRGKACSPYGLTMFHNFDSTAH